MVTTQSDLYNIKVSNGSEYMKGLIAFIQLLSFMK